MSLDKQLATELFAKMLLIRRFEEKICEIYHTDVVKSPVHLSIGQEAVAVGVCQAMAESDFVSNTYRCHATHIAKGGDLNKMMAELFGKIDGCAGGKAGSMHLIDMDKGILGASAVVATTIPVATGHALAQKMENNNKVVVCFFGDGATEEGVFTESINFAALHKLPIIFVCENNGLAIHNDIKNRWAGSDIIKRVQTYGIKTEKIDSGDVFEIFEASQKAIEQARSGEGPVFMEIATYRYMQHVGVSEDLNEDYRDMEEYKLWKSKDQIDLLAKELGEVEVARIEKQVAEQIEESIKYAESSEFPGEEELLKHVYA